MKLAIMQPYLFPYIGYFQLISLSDTFVVHDDVQYIKGGWINRNRILVNGQSQYIILPVEKAPAHLNINARFFTTDFDSHKQKALRQIENAYKKAPYFYETMPVIEEALAIDDRNVSRFIVHSLRRCCAYLKISTPFLISSEMNKKNELRGISRVIEINRLLGANHYINPIGGAELYKKAVFQKSGIRLSFLQCRDISYTQFGNGHVPLLSIIDVMMFNDAENIKKFLGEFDLK